MSFFDLDDNSKVRDTIRKEYQELEDFFTNSEQLGIHDEFIPTANHLRSTFESMNQSFYNAAVNHERRLNGLHSVCIQDEKGCYEDDQQVYLDPPSFTKRVRGKDLKNANVLIQWNIDVFNQSPHDVIVERVCSIPDFQDMRILSPKSTIVKSKSSQSIPIEWRPKGLFSSRSGFVGVQIYAPEQEKSFLLCSSFRIVEFDVRVEAPVFVSSDFTQLDKLRSYVVSLPLNPGANLFIDEREKHHPEMKEFSLTSDGDYHELNNHFQNMHKFLEEEWKQIKDDMYSYVLYDASGFMKEIKNNFWKIEIRGLVDGTPPLSFGSRVVIKVRRGNYNAMSYEGYVSEIRRTNNYVLVHVNLPKDMINGKKTFVNVYFQPPSRMFSDLLSPIVQVSRQLSMDGERNGVLKSFMTSLGLADLGKSAVSEDLQAIVVSKCYSGHPFDEVQLSAISKSVNWKSEYGPLLIFGPPGTGKSVALVEIAMQIFMNHPKDGILLCCPSNEAADNITRMLLPLFDQSVVRLNSLQRDLQECPVDLHRVCLIDMSGRFRAPQDNDSLGSKRIFVSTCYSARLLEKVVDHIKYVLIDEAAQAYELEAMIPISSVTFAASSESLIVILSGDHSQLGPLIRSQKLSKNSLGKSLFERLFIQFNGNKFFEDGENSDLSNVIFFRRNYRSTKELIELSSNLFYKGLVVPYSSAPSLNSSPAFRVYGVDGDEWQASSGKLSFYNQEEANRILECILTLVSTKKRNPRDIGVICSFRSQVKLVREILRSNGLSAVSVGGISDFQGLEFNVILLSTTLSSSESYQRCKSASIGLMSEACYFNVAISRPRELLIAFGNPFIWAVDKYWKHLLLLALKNRSYYGCHFPPALAYDDAERSLSDISSNSSSDQDQELLKDFEVCPHEKPWRINL